MANFWHLFFLIIRNDLFMNGQMAFIQFHFSEMIRNDTGVATSNDELKSGEDLSESNLNCA